ncbi:hypothetical protein PENTCL1PPCAC_1755 [Pristionchus entomophagus]|uniref:Uncharacterized protein n=1 Tax=Pristionchus entomophagus TaxID=358040 RepID=A0AAV5SA28_9BILA|nr:hypothetical protein PENTCL1PPCAC_1755 [Pristionchus entomophagus]
MKYQRCILKSVMAASANGTLTTLKSTSPVTKGLLEDFPKMVLRPLIPADALPETVGPDSPYRHHPKYQKKNQDQALDFNMGQSLSTLTTRSKDEKKEAKEAEDSGNSSTASSMSSLPDNPEALKMMLSKFMDDVISGELVASN